MKKILIGLVLVLVGWLVKLSYDMLQLTHAQNRIQASLYQAQQNNSSLNDQIVALQREREKLVPQTTNAQITATNPLTLIQQQLDLIEFALKQQQYSYALEKFSHLEVDLKNSAVSESLKAALSAAIIKDRQDIQKFVNARQSQQQHVNQLLQQIDNVLTAEIRQQNLSIAQSPDQAFWKKWLQVEAVDTPARTLMQRQFVLKEAQLHLLLARQMLLQGQYLAYQQEMNVVVQSLNTIPDHKAQQILNKIESAKALTTLVTPLLTTRALLR
jgi:hypothetical protein